MKSFIAVFTMIAVSLALTGTSFAAEKGKAKGGGGLLPAIILQKLSADQKAKYDGIVADYQKEVKAAAGDKDKALAARKDANKKVQAILTDDQKAELKKLAPAKPPKKN
jgi:hypothetical protein